jgi:hypothetical protein
MKKIAITAVALSASLLVLSSFAKADLPDPGMMYVKGDTAIVT